MSDRPEPVRDRRADLFDHLMRERHGVRDLPVGPLSPPSREDTGLLRAALDQSKKDILSLDHIGLAYLGVDAKQAARPRDEEYDPYAFAR